MHSNMPVYFEYLVITSFTIYQIYPSVSILSELPENTLLLLFLELQYFM